MNYSENYTVGGLQGLSLNMSSLNTGGLKDKLTAYFNSLYLDSSYLPGYLSLSLLGKVCVCVFVSFCCEKISPSLFSPRSRPCPSHHH